MATAQRDLPVLEVDLQRKIHRRLERQGWEVEPGVQFFPSQGDPWFCRIDLIARRPRRALLIEVKTAWPPYNGIGQLVFYYYSMKRHGGFALPTDLVLATWQWSRPLSTALMEACHDVGIRLWLFNGNYRCFTMKRIGSSWVYVPLDDELAPPRS